MYMYVLCNILWYFEQKFQYARMCGHLGKLQILLTWNQHGSAEQSERRKSTMVHTGKSKLPKIWQYYFSQIVDQPFIFKWKCEP